MIVSRSQILPGRKGLIGKIQIRVYKGSRPYPQSAGTVWLCETLYACAVSQVLRIRSLQYEIRARISYCKRRTQNEAICAYAVALYQPLLPKGV